MPPLQTRWGNVTLTKEIPVPLYDKTLEGTIYLTGDFGKPIWELRCDCGHTWQMCSDEFQGRRKLRSCGRKGCIVGKTEEAPRTKLGRPPIADRGMAATIYMPMSILMQVNEMAIERNSTVGRVLAEAFEFWKATV
jgi:hypothetical protein